MRADKADDKTIVHNYGHGGSGWSLSWGSSAIATGNALATGVREGCRALISLPELPKPAALRELAQVWSPHQTVAAWYLWRIPRSRGQAPL